MVNYSVDSGQPLRFTSSVPTAARYLMTNYEFIRVEHGDAMSWIVLNRPDRANALSEGLLDEFSEALERLKHEGAPVIGIRGEGRGFSAGFELGEVGQPIAEGFDPIADRERLHRNLNRWLAIWDHPKPVIAAIHGYCLAGGTMMCVYTDITVVAHDAQIGEPKIPIGGGYVAPLWAPLVGPKRAKEMSFVPGNSIDGRTAVEWGWANHSVEQDELIDAVEGLASRIAKTSPEMLRIKKLSINRAMEAMGVRHAASAVPEMDALAHMSHSVVALREQVRTAGLRAALDDYRSAPTTPLVPERVNGG
jgi:enoyl-CoA hydratase